MSMAITIDTAAAQRMPARPVLIGPDPRPDCWDCGRRVSHTQRLLTWECWAAIICHRCEPFVRSVLGHQEEM